MSNEFEGVGMLEHSLSSSAKHRRNGPLLRANQVVKKAETNLSRELHSLQLDFYQ